MILALAPGTAPANTPSASLQFVNQAQLQENGSVNVTLVYQCLPGFLGTDGIVVVNVEQPGASGLAIDRPAKCDDQKHRLTLNVGPGPFTAGSAAAIGQVINDNGSSHAEKQAELTIK